MPKNIEDTKVGYIFCANQQPSERYTPLWPKVFRRQKCQKIENFIRGQIVVDIKYFGYFEGFFFITKRRIQTHAKRATKGR